MSAFTIAPDGKSITCQKCGRTSHNLNDVKEKYCGFCHKWHNPNPLPKSTCPVCGYETDAATRAAGEESQPVPGDLSLCMKCGEVGAFKEDMTIRPATLTDLGTLGKRESRLLTRAQALIRKKRPLG
jgi:ribosomal protein L37E